MSKKIEELKAVLNAILEDASKMTKVISTDVCKETNRALNAQRHLADAVLDMLQCRSNSAEYKQAKLNLERGVFMQVQYKQHCRDADYADELFD